MAFELKPLPYAENALTPVLSPQTIDFHYGKHHATYVRKLNELAEAAGLEEQSLETLIRTTDGALFNNAAQVWNHDLYWNSMTPDRGTKPGPELASAIVDRFGSTDALKNAFIQSAAANFGSGWTWLVRSARSGLEVVNTSNAHTPLTGDVAPVLVCDVWEHAYYIDYRNARPDYLERWWEFVNWEHASNLYEAEREPERLAV
jgi:Fe-Mn family superoxide dismutase